MANFSKALAYTLQNEGGFVNNSKDRGGPTNKGITLKLYSQYCGTLCTAQQLQNISDEDVAGVYNRFFWSLLNLNQVNSDSIATCLFDMAVNMGPHESAELAQKYLITVPTLLPFVRAIDGVIGPVTRQALNSTDPDEFIQGFSDEVLEHYANICKKDDSQSQFLKGWVARGQRLLTLKTTEQKNV